MPQDWLRMRLLLWACIAFQRLFWCGMWMASPIEVAVAANPVVPIALISVL
ncbi:MAG: hypothetical protein ACQCN6_00905 [Candidatus Bathyarchaeia archaeon]|jgi:hypothetical protein